jgi:hypothetical protein
VKPGSCKRELLFAALLVVFWVVVLCLALVTRGRPERYAWVMGGGVLGTVLIYWLRMFLGGLLFDESYKDMELPSWLGYLLLALIVIGGVATVFFVVTRFVIGVPGH